MTQRLPVAYLCNAIEESVKAERRIVTDSPAATNKVLGLAAAMREADMHCVVLSLGRGRQNGSMNQHRALSCRSRSAVVLYCAFVHVPILTHLVTMLSLIILLARLVKKYPKLTLLVYNRGYHYVPALIVARIVGLNSFLDLEDGYNIDDGGWFRCIKNKLTRITFNWLCPAGTMVANSGLASQQKNPSPLVCYGVAQCEVMPCQNWQSGRLQVIFSGTLLEEVGSHLLISSLKILREQRPDLSQKLSFVVTGKGPCAEAFRSFSASDPDLLSFHETLPRSAYLEVLRKSHVGLSLRLSRFEMGETTFPSKVIEYAENGLLVLSTRSSDVPLLFGESAVYLDSQTPEALASLLADLSQNRDCLQRIADAGRQRVMSVCSPSNVGLGLKELLGNRGKC